MTRRIILDIPLFQVYEDKPQPRSRRGRFIKASDVTKQPVFYGELRKQA